MQEISASTRPIGYTKTCQYLSKHKDLILSTLIFYIAAHGEVLFHKVGYHDDLAHFFGIGTTYPSGRWMLGLLKLLHEHLVGDDMWSLPVFNGGLILILLIACICLLADYFRIQHGLIRVIFSALFVVHPSVIGFLGYLFTGPAYAFGVFLAVASGLLLSAGNKLHSPAPKIPPLCLTLAGILAGAASVGIYQSYIAFTLLILIFSLLRSAQSDSFLTVLRKILACLFSVLAIFLTYLIIWKLSLAITGSKPTTYKGIDQFGLSSIPACLERIPETYTDFFLLCEQLYPYNCVSVFTLLVRIVIIGAPAIIILSSHIKNKIISLLLVACIPPAVNFTYLLTGEMAGYLSMFPHILLFSGLLAALDTAAKPGSVSKRAFLAIRSVLLLLILIIGLFHVRFANQAALKSEYVQRQYSSYFSSLVTKIQCTENYTTKTPILLYNVRKARGLALPEAFQEVDAPFAKENLVRYDSEKTARVRLKRYLLQWCGFQPTYTDDESAISEDILKEMPRYPNAGSIQIIDGILVIKF